MIPGKLIEINWGRETPPPPQHDPEPKSLFDQFVSDVSESYRAVRCRSLRHAFNELRTNPRIMKEPNRPRDVPLMMAFHQVEARVIKLTSAIEAGGVAGCHAARKAQKMVTEGLENLVLKQSLNPI